MKNQDRDTNWTDLRQGVIAVSVVKLSDVADYGRLWKYSICRLYPQESESALKKRHHTSDTLSTPALSRCLS